MPHAEAEFAELMSRWHNGCPDAAQALFDRYGHQILAVVRHRMNDRMRRDFDSEDLLQSVWASFFRRDVNELEFRHPDDLARLLTKMARNKMVDAVRHQARQPQVEAGGEESTCRQNEPRAHVPSPSQAAMEGESWNRLLADLPPLCSRILYLLREGRSHEEIADDIGMNAKTIQRLVHHMALKQGNRQ